MKKIDLIIIGGSAAGMVTASTVRKFHKDKTILIIRDQPEVPVPCGIPYIFGTLKSSSEDIVPDKNMTDKNIDILIDRVIKVDLKEKIVETKTGEKFGYEKLVFATGSNPTIPSFIKGTELKNVYTITKYIYEIDALKDALKGLNKVVVIGGGFIGIEVSDEINKLKKNVTLISSSKNILWKSFDEKFSSKVEEILIKRGINLIKGKRVTEIAGDGKVSHVVFNDGDKMEADAVILSLGTRAKSELAKDASLSLDETGAIMVDGYMRTSVKDVYAVGDCAHKTDFFTGKTSGVMLASIAAAEARIASLNMYGIVSSRKSLGTVSAFSTKVGNLVVASAGLTEMHSVEEGYDVVVGEASATDRHPGKFDDVSMQDVKLIFERRSGYIIGGQISGGVSVGEMINIIALAIQQRMTISEMVHLQIATHPLVTSAPTAYPIVMAALDALSKY
ncbi:MAG: FAD-dependent oxidoreductase [Thermoanaerobacteraceae bacterium]|nr:FAD-dependent oxidoreductase [Thermoanaerobacteraceae bacterium]